MSNPAATEVLRAARDLLSEPGAWTQFHYARDKNGECLLSPSAPEARSWCAVGALAAIGQTETGVIKAAESALKSSLPQPYSSIATFNDTEGRTVDEVLHVFGLAIKHSEDPDTAL